MSAIERISAYLSRREKTRKAKEAKELALSKLTEEDKKALGLGGKNR